MKLKGLKSVLIQENYHIQSKNADTVKALYGRLHFGELEVIVGAKELGIDFAIIDEHAARKWHRNF